MIFKLITEFQEGWADYKDEELAEEKGAEWIAEYPDAVVMLLPLETAVCKHCDQTIREKPGWVLHRWVHENSGAYLCWLKMTQAEPKEDG